jgi:propionyl-CoA carboxylase alpha chain
LADNDQNFYFLEMNTRLQVEHPVTELITGIDLVELMFKVSAGQPIPADLLATDWSQPKNFNGWAVESRVYAEDPTRDFLPSVGLLTRYVEPTTPGVRCDSGVADGSEISMYYDPMICKLCTHGDDRVEAIDRMVEALDSYVIEGLKHNIPLLYDIVDSKEFRTGELTTNFIKYKYGDEGFQSTLSSAASNNLAALVAVVHSATLKQKVGFHPSAGRQSNVTAFNGFSVSVEMTGSAGSVKHDVVVDGADGELQVSIDGGDPIAVSSNYNAADSIVHANLDSQAQIAQFVEETLTGYTIQYQGSVFDVNVLSQEQQQAMEWMPVIPELDLSRLIVAPISGTVRAISVEIGDEVGPGQEVVVLEAMKMHNVLRANSAGVVKAIHFATGDVVSAEEFIVELE